ncbi:hypothetical protein RMATCC62417_00176 [Rhizopus microsporus]|nr:hypothetical protein RMATCC62417_00176 [Rhizopus microsporus]
MYDQFFVDQKLQTQKKEAILKSDSESVLNVLRKGQRIAFDVLLDISIIMELIVEDYLQSEENKLDINQIIPKEAQREEINLILSVPKPVLKKDLFLQKSRPVKERREYEFLSHRHWSFVFSHFFGKESGTSSSEESVWFGKVEPLDIVLTECPPQMRSLIELLLKTFATNIATIYSDFISPITTTSGCHKGKKYFDKRHSFRNLNEKAKKKQVNCASYSRKIIKKRLWRHRKRLRKLQAKQKSGGSINANRLCQEKYIIKKLEDQLRESCQTECGPVGESSTQMDVHLPTEERNATSDVASPMLTEETSAGAANNDTGENKLKKIARYIKSLLMRQDSIHETIDSQSIERNLEHLELSNLEVSAVLNIHNFFK